MPAKSFNWDRCLQHAALSDIGMRRRNNQDSYAEVMAGDVESWYQRGHVFIVADGMGAHAAGELASKMAADNIPHLYHKHGELSPPEAILKAIQETNAVIHRRGEANAEFHNMGTTSSSLLLLPQGALVAHVGDSRVYRLRDEQLQQLTFDHSLVWEMRAAGQLSGDDSAPGIPKNVITRSLGPHATVQVDLEGPFPAQVGDIFLLCSDGLSGKVTDEEMGPILASLPPREAAQVLVDLAKLRGGPDNITVIIVKVTGPEITTQVSRAEPLTVGGDIQNERAVHPVLWIITGVCFLAAAGMLIANQSVPALLAFLGGVVAAAVGILQKFAPGKLGISLTGGKRLGRGPHRRVDCPVNQAFVQHLHGELENLQQSVLKNAEPWNTDSEAFQGNIRQAREVAQQQDYPQAVRLYGLAIRQLMSELTAQINKQTSDSSIDY